MVSFTVTKWVREKIGIENGETMLLKMRDGAGREDGAPPEAGGGLGSAMEDICLCDWL